MPGIDELRNFCNTGYAKGRCARFPNLPNTPDAIRFSIEGDGAGSITLMYIEETEYAPTRFGTLMFDISGRMFEEQTGPENVRAQAEMFVASYLRRKVQR